MLLGRLSLATLLAALLPGCGGYKESATPFAGQGDAVLQNNAVMIVDPQPVGAANTDIDMDGQRAFVAIERYHADAVVQPPELGTTEELPVVGSPQDGDTSGAPTMK